MKKAFKLALLFLFISASSFCQVLVNDTKNIYDVVKSLEGPGVSISNISYHFPSGYLRSWGYFKDNGTTGLSEGLLLTTGGAKLAEGPNNRSNIGQSSYDYYVDNDLMQYAQGLSLYDVSFVEFDFTSSSNELSFNFVFGSEEYPEYLSYGDIFAFIISGPGIIGKKNIALVPGTNLPVAVTTINPYTKSQYYVNNGDGSTPWINKNIQYDGYTVVLKAQSNVIPCQKYHIKLAIADAKDGVWDSGVFIEQGSFTSFNNPEVYLEYEDKRFDYLTEGCNSANVIVKRPKGSSNSSPVTYHFTIAGSATNGIDYTLINNTVSISAGVDSAFFKINTIKDNVKEKEEFIDLSIKSSCSTTIDLVNISIPIKDLFQGISNEAICLGDHVELNKLHLGKDSLVWDRSSFLDCEYCLSPTANPTETKYFSYTVTDTISGCYIQDSVLVEVYNLTADFNFHFEECYTKLDVFLNNESSNNSTNYLWMRNNEEISRSQNPTYQFPYENTINPLQFDITLIASRNNPSCSAETTKTIIINEPLFLPNLITPDNDGKNEYLQIKGIGNACWSLNIYNKWGALIYSRENYNNDFNGHEIEDGIYFYSIKNNLGDREYKGWVEVINRKE